VNNFGGVDHGIEELGDVLLLVAFPFCVSNFRRRRIVVTVGEYVELLDESVVGVYLRSSCG
jgi:hypothetical protein